MRNVLFPHDFDSHKCTGTILIELSDMDRGTILDLNRFSCKPGNFKLTVSFSESVSYYCV